MFTLHQFYSSHAGRYVDAVQAIAQSGGNISHGTHARGLYCEFGTSSAETQTRFHKFIEKCGN